MLAEESDAGDEAHGHVSPGGPKDGINPGPERSGMR